MSNEGARGELEGIAVIGMAVRMPGACNLEAFWRNLRDGVESVSRFTDVELLEAGISPELIRHPNFVKATAILEDAEMFDAAFFGISPREAELMDPQHRLLMECAWEVLEHAGYNSETYAGRIAVFTSAGLNTYFPMNICSNPGLVERVGGFQLSIFSDQDFVPTRIAYSMNLKGAGVSIGTACSSSLVSVHLACQSLLTYQCDMALVGAVTVHFPQKMGHLYEEGTAYSPDSHCRPFDATPSGLVDGNGMGAVVLKRLEDALTDGDCIYAVIKGTAVNNDGSLKVGYTAPSVEGQAEVITEAHAMAGVPPETITYVETHGTATRLGDPIEIAALTLAFRAGTSRNGFCGIGSVKSNIGHVDKAAGLAGLIKTVLALRHGMIPPTLHLEQPNPRLNLAATPFYVVNKLTAWPRDGKTPQRAGVSSFGVGGTNAHAVLEEAPAAPPGTPSRPLQLLMLSAKTEAALEAATENLAAFLEQQPDVNLADVSYTLQVGRRAFARRRAVACTSVLDAMSGLRAALQRHTGLSGRADGGVIFMFPGQGAQYPGMGRELYLREPAFREQVDLCAGHLEPELGLDIRRLLFPEAGTDDEAAGRLAQTALTQPVLFTIEYALARLWMGWGLQPRAMIGHSLGEYVAACLAGVFSLQDALTLIAVRGRLMQQLPPGAMLAVPLAEAEIRPFLGEGVDLAAVNGPAMCVVSGPTPAVEALQHRLAGRGLSCQRLHTSHAFHSAMMDPILPPFTERAQGLELKPPQLPYLSNLTGNWITEAEATRPRYWAQHLRQTVRFAAGLERLLGKEPPLLLEVGPGRTLSGLAAHMHADQRPLCFTSLPQARENRGAQDFLLHTLADLWLAGATVDWTGFYRYERRLRLALPTYPFQRQRYWIEPGRVGVAKQAATAVKKPDMADWFYLPAWKRTLTLEPQTTAESAGSPWLIFPDGHGLAQVLEVELGRMGHQVVRVQPGPGFALHGESTYTVHPSRPDDFEALLDALLERAALPQRLVHVWGWGSPAGDNNRHTADGLGPCFDSLLYLARALDRRALPRDVEMTVIADRMRDVSGETTIDPAKAALLGLLATLRREIPHLTCRAVDIPPPRVGAWQIPGLATRLIRELSAPVTDQIVALRAGQRWIPDLEPVRLQAPGAGETGPSSGLLRTGGVYLITGGLDDTGLLLARQVAAMVRAKLVLTTTAPLPEGGSQTPFDALAGPVALQLRELESQSCEVMPIHVPVFDARHLEAALTRAEERFGRIDGVIHAAHMNSPQSFCLIRDLDKTALDEHVRSQARGLFALEECLRKRQPAFCMLMSSLASEVGGLGQAAHAAACLYQDAFAHLQNQAGGGPWVVINWDVWQAEGDRAGMNAALAEIALTPGEGADAFRRILARDDLTRIAVSTTDPRQRDAVLRSRTQRVHTASAATAPSGRHARPDLPTAYEAPRNDIEATMAGLWQELLGIDRVGIHDNFFDLGGHSLLATQLLSALHQTFHVALELEVIFEASTVAQLTEALLHSRLAQEKGERLALVMDQLEAMSEGEAQALLESGALPPDLLAALTRAAHSEATGDTAPEQPDGPGCEPTRSSGV
jgi:acyl transferase domain-containing protein